MKHSIISILVAGLFAGTAITALAADEVKSESKPADTPTSRAGDPDAKDEMGTKGDTVSKSQAMHDKGAAAFKKADRDNDGTLDKKEAKSMPRVAKNFDAIDTDSDGNVSKEEFQAWRAKNPGRGGGRRPQGPPPEAGGN